MIDEHGVQRIYPAYTFIRNFPDGSDIVVSLCDQSLPLGTDEGREGVLAGVERFLKACGLLESNEHLDVIEK